MTVLNFLRLTWFLCCVALSSKQPADAQQTALATLLQANCYELHGAGWGDERTKKELSEAQFVAIGEDMERAKYYRSSVHETL
jgi:hypothetical protein